MNDVLIAPKSIWDFVAEEYYTYVCEMHELRVKGSRAPKARGPTVSGLSVSRTKKGALSIRKSKARTFAYVTFDEIAKLAASAKCSQSELWQLFKAKKYLVTRSRMEAEQIYADIKEIPW